MMSRMDGKKTQHTHTCSELNVDGLRGDIVTNRAAKAYAAFQGKKYVVVIEDIGKIIILCLRHRLKKDPLETIDSGYKVKNNFKRFLKSSDFKS